MRIAVITTGFAKDENDFGGAAALHNFVRELAQTPRMDITVFAMYYPFDMPEYSLFGAKVFSFASVNVNAKPAKMKIWKELKKIFSIEHNKKNFDLIQALWLGESGYLAAQMSKKHMIPMVAASCGGELAGIKSIGYGSQLKRWQKYFVIKTLEQAKFVIIGSDFNINYLKHVYKGKFLGKAVKIPFGVDETMFKFSKHSLSNDGKIALLNVASVLPVKAHEDLFKAVKIVKEKFPGITLICCGNDGKNNLPGLSEKYGIDNNLIIKGEVDHKEMPEIMKSADIFVLSSLHESQNMSIIEASFCGLPVVSTDVGAAKDVTPYLVKPGNYKQLAEEIIKVITDYEAAKKKCASVFNKYRETFTLQGSTKNILKLYNRIVN
jgi:glycosyltransferase involved in cell wall biosynthesis